MGSTARPGEQGGVYRRDHAVPAQDRRQPRGRGREPLRRHRARHRRRPPGVPHGVPHELLQPRRSAGSSSARTPFNASWTVAVGASAKGTLDCVSAWLTDFRSDLPRIIVPTLIIHGDADRILPIEVTAVPLSKSIAGARLVTIEGGPHGVLWTHGGAVSAELVSFLEQLPATPSRAAAGPPDFLKGPAHDPHTLTPPGHRVHDARPVHHPRRDRDPLRRHATLCDEERSARSRPPEVDRAAQSAARRLHRPADPVQAGPLEREGAVVHRAAQAVRRDQRGGRGLRGPARRAGRAARRHRRGHRRRRRRAHDARSTTRSRSRPAPSTSPRCPTRWRRSAARRASASRR